MSQRKFAEGIIGSLKRAAKSMARSVGVDISRHRKERPPVAPMEAVASYLEKIRHEDGHEEELSFLKFCVQHFRASNAQLFQDLFVLFQTKEKKAGYFVEFGATDGITLSNTYLLERGNGWTGILAEPARRWHPQINNNRKCSVDYRCVWSSTGAKLEFTETSAGELSTISEFANCEGHSQSQHEQVKYIVDTISLDDLLAEHDAPRDIDYLSIDTEGSELEILSNFNFDDHNIGIITVEHNYLSPAREQLFDLLTSRGYVRKLTSFSKWDDWYVKAQ